MAKLDLTIPNLKLNDGNAIPMLGFGIGTAWFKNGQDRPIDQGTIDGIKTAINVGFLHLDAAEMYNTEKELGTAIKESGVERDKFFITGKVLNTSMNDIQGALKRSLSDMQLDYVDLYLIHQPWWAKSDADLQRAWADMEAIQQAGLAKSIGVSNFWPKHLKPLLQTAKVVPALNQIEFHPYMQCTELLDFHKQHGIATGAFGPLTAATRGAPGPCDDYVARLAKKYAVSANEIYLRWCIDQDVVPITTSGKEQRLSDYLRSVTFKLTPVEIKEINELGQQKRFRSWLKNYYDANDESL